MKKSILTIILFCSLLISNAQVTQVAQINNGASGTNLQLVHLNSGYKFTCLFDSSSQTSPGVWTNYYFIRVYDLNGNLEKNILLPTINWPGFQNTYIVPVNSSLVSDHLFNSDNDLEFLVQYFGSKACVSDPFSNYDSTELYLMSETGAILNTLGSISNCTSTSFYNSFSYSYYSDGQTFSKLILKTNHYNNSTPTTDIFNLPGFLPCESCVSSVGISSNNPAADGMRIGVFPNPSSNEFTFQYTLQKHKNSGELLIYDLNGKVVKTVPVTSEKGSVSINMNDLSSGVYVFKLKCGDIISSSQKLILAN